MGNNMPAISIIIPMYGVEKYLRRCLDSVLNQTFTDWTAICVDDGSPDKSGDIATEYAKKDKRFIVVHKENGGLSDARNYGMPFARGKYIMYLDSDDFIHPQTMEIAYNLAVKNKSDIVSFTYDRFYRPQLMVRHILRMDTDNVKPYGIKKRYNISKLKTKTTDDVFEYATEQTHNKFNPKRKWLIKHCQVWKNLYKRSLIADIPFIKGILFEDFPWWSAIMLKRPRTTVVPLPLYYYIPNFGGIVLSAKQLRIMQSLCTGIKTAFTLYTKKANSEQMKKWQMQFMWFFVNWAFRKLKYLKTDDEINTARTEFIQMQKMGVFDNVPNDWYELRENIYKFINN
ncbi:MAG: glycosyltransferase [Alphaproteobacteria bacterium]|nr:glycosyltransferase [Alphaproteobacteria bacterium]